MGLDDDIRERVKAVLDEPWEESDGQVVPRTSDVTHKNGAVNLNATFLYADLAGSTQLQKNYKNTFAAKAIRMYLSGATTIIRKEGGSIKSFDGDRVMGVFVGSSMRNDAVRAAFAINWLVKEVINPLVRERYEKNDTSVWVAEHGIGIDSGETFVARAGVRNRSGETNHNDLIFVGRAPNVAAKLSALRGADAGPIVITSDVYRYLNDKQKTRFDGAPTVWSEGSEEAVGPHPLTLYRTSYWRSFK